MEGVKSPGHEPKGVRKARIVKGYN